MTSVIDGSQFRPPTLPAGTAVAPPGPATTWNPGTWHVADADGVVIGFVAIDRIVAGRSCGGIRAGPRVTAQQIERIARVMTLKCGFVGVAAGGAKGGVIVPESFTDEERAARLDAYGRAVAALLRSGVWSHGADMGTTDFDIARIRHAAGIAPDPGLSPTSPPAAAGDASSGMAAGLTVALATEAALEALGIPLSGARIAIHGVGAVGRAAMTALAAAGARIVAVSTVAGAICDDSGMDAQSVLEEARRLGDRFTAGAAAPEALLDVSCDALLLCGGADVIDTKSAQAIRARTIICGANIPFVDEVAERFERRGILVLPDFVAGGGGVLGSTLVAVAGLTPGELAAVMRRQFKPLVEQTIAQARTSGTTVAAQAREKALRTLAACEAAYGAQRADTLLPEKLAPRASAPVRFVLAAERRVRGSRRLAPLARLLHGTVVDRAERVLCATRTVGAAL
ncbi:Glu/Leu/Phe/Val dehydrogenase [Betaproteobacteria bacterium PRO7]|nr:Glu/Leu/Phe/Val dehydrogenase [Betaproteobacteria bacterium PRO7]